MVNACTASTFANLRPDHHRSTVNWVGGEPGLACSVCDNYQQAINTLATRPALSAAANAVSTICISKIDNEETKTKINFDNRLLDYRLTSLHKTYLSVAARAGMLVVNVTNIISAKMTRNIDSSLHSPSHLPVTATDSAAVVTHSQL